MGPRLTKEPSGDELWASEPSGPYATGNSQRDPMSAQKDGVAIVEKVGGPVRAMWSRPSCRRRANRPTVGWRQRLANGDGALS
jgi:hypothetical protein